MDALLLRVGLGDDSTTNHFAKMPRFLPWLQRESFKAVLREYKKSSASDSDDRAYLQRWVDDDRAEQVWDKIQCAARSNHRWLPPKTFIRDILAARPVAIAIAHRRKLRKCYRNAAKKWSGLLRFCANRTPTTCPVTRKAQHLLGYLMTLPVIFARKRLRRRRAIAA
jgi:hypothetical protein